MSNTTPQTVARALAAVLVITAMIVAAGGAVATTQASKNPSFVVDLAADGSAEITLTLTKDLETDDERAAFQTLQNDSETRADARERFASRMAGVASNADNGTSRDMAVSDATIDLSVSDDGSVGVVELGVTWTNLAASEDGTLVVTEPFASGFEPDRAFTVRGPDGYELSSASPSPGDEGSNAATWSAGSNLSGFEVVFEPTSAGDADSSGLGLGAPGFGIVAALAAFAALAALVAAGRARKRR